MKCYSCGRELTTREINYICFEYQQKVRNRNKSMNDWIFCPYCKDDEDKLLNEGCCYCENTGKIRKSEYPDDDMKEIEKE